MPNVLLPILSGHLDANYCFTTWEQTLLDFANAMQAQLPGMAFYNYGDTVPAPEFELYPWLNTNDMRWYRFTGAWISPNPETSTEVIRIFIGIEGDIATYDGGDTGTPGPQSGPMWERVTAFNARFPVGVGTFPSTLAVGVNDTGGSEQHTLSAAEGATASHIHPIGKSNNAAGAAGDDAWFPKNSLTTVPSYNATYITGSGPVTPAVLTEADLFTLPSGMNGAGVPSPTAFSLLPPYIGVFFIRRTGRQYYKV